MKIKTRHLKYDVRQSIGAHFTEMQAPEFRIAMAKAMGAPVKKPEQPSLAALSQRPTPTKKADANAHPVPGNDTLVLPVSSAAKEVENTCVAMRRLSVSAAQAQVHDLSAVSDAFVSALPPNMMSFLKYVAPKDMEMVNACVSMTPEELKRRQHAMAERKRRAKIKQTKRDDALRPLQEGDALFKHLKPTYGDGSDNDDADWDDEDDQSCDEEDEEEDDSDDADYEAGGNGRKRKNVHPEANPLAPVRVSKLSKQFKKASALVCKNELTPEELKLRVLLPFDPDDTNHRFINPFVEKMHAVVSEHVDLNVHKPGVSTGLVNCIPHTSIEKPHVHKEVCRPPTMELVQKALAKVLYHALLMRNYNKLSESEKSRMELDQVSLLPKPKRRAGARRPKFSWSKLSLLFNLKQVIHLYFALRLHRKQTSPPPRFSPCRTRFHPEQKRLAELKEGKYHAFTKAEIAAHQIANPDTLEHPSPPLDVVYCCFFDDTSIRSRSKETLGLNNEVIMSESTAATKSQAFWCAFTYTEYCGHRVTEPPSLTANEDEFRVTFYQQTENGERAVEYCFTDADLEAHLRAKDTLFFSCDITGQDRDRHGDPQALLVAAFTCVQSVGVFTGHVIHLLVNELYKEALRGNSLFTTPALGMYAFTDALRQPKNDINRLLTPSKHALSTHGLVVRSLRCRAHVLRSSYHLKLFYIIVHRLPWNKIDPISQQVVTCYPLRDMRGENPDAPGKIHFSVALAKIGSTSSASRSYVDPFSRPWEIKSGPHVACPLYGSLDLNGELQLTAPGCLTEWPLHELFVNHLLGVMDFLNCLPIQIAKQLAFMDGGELCGKKLVQMVQALKYF